MAMRRRLMAGPRSAKGRVARLSVIRIGLARSRQCACDAGKTGLRKRGHGAFVGPRGPFDDRKCSGSPMEPQIRRESWIPA